MSCSAKENVMDTLNDSILSSMLDADELEIIAKSIVSNLVIEHQRFPKWD